MRTKVESVEDADKGTEERTKAIAGGIGPRGRHHKTNDNLD